MIFDIRPKDFIVVSDDLTTANMDPWFFKPVVFQQAWEKWTFLKNIKIKLYKRHVKLKENCKQKHFNVWILDFHRKEPEI